VGSTREADEEHGVGADPATWPTGRLLSAAARRMEHAWNAYLAQWHLNHASLPALAMLAAGPRTQRDLAEALGVTEQTTSRIVAGLERAGHLSREHDPTDARRRRLAISAQGREALMALNEEGAIDGLVDHGLTQEEEATLRALLTRFL
jgi:MarR family transcriptional regulator, organic hydroperoxide resistance regulator